MQSAKRHSASLLDDAPPDVLAYEAELLAGSRDVLGAKALCRAAAWIHWTLPTMPNERRTYAAMVLATLLRTLGMVPTNRVPKAARKAIARQKARGARLAALDDLL